jgi:predicted Zn finger-like uncharacterized protein
MKTVTRCPGCSTVFLVRREQLEAREGRVRCGACGTVFDARASLEVLEGAAEVPQAAPPAAEAPPSPTAIAPVRTTPAEARDELFEDTQPILLDMGPVPGAEALPPGSGDGSAAAPEEVATLVLPGRVPPPRHEADDEARAKGKEPLFAEDQGDAGTAASGASAAGDTDAGAGAVAGFGLAADPGAHPEFDVAPVPDAGAPSADSATGAETKSDTSPAEGEAAEETGRGSRGPAAAIVIGPPPGEAAVPDFVAERREQQRVARTWALASIPVALLLALQLALHWRAELGALAPGLRGLLNVLCAPFHCEVGLPQHPELLTLEGTNLEADASGTLTLYSTLRNRARYEQALPAIELTLTDPRDQPVARRLLAPSDYAPARREGIPPGGELPVRVAIDAAAIKAAGFRAEAVYP